MAIAGMHYTAMAGLTLVPHATPASGAPALSTDLLAILVAVVAFLVSGIFLLTLVPDRPAVIATNPTEASTEATTPPLIPAVDIGKGSYAPQGGAGGPPRRLARHLPIQRDGGTQFVGVDDIVAVHANAHYAYVFDGRSQLFCPLSISHIEARLDGERFVRVHRSHIVNIAHVVGLRRAGDQGVVELSGPDRPTVPVSRNRMRALKSRLGPSVNDTLVEDRPFG
jgi:hypothetical protein